MWHLRDSNLQSPNNRANSLSDSPFRKHTHLKMWTVLVFPCTLLPFGQFSHSCLRIFVGASNVDRWRFFVVVVVQVSTGRQDTFCLIGRNLISPSERYQCEIQRRYLIICHYKYRSHSAACAAFTVTGTSLFSRDI